MRRLLGPVLAALAATLLISGSAQATFPGKNGKLTLTQRIRRVDVPHNNLLITVNPDGSGASVLASSASGYGYWSADGKRIAFNSGLLTYCCHASPTIEVLNADGTGHTTALPPTSFIDGTHRWSPDGTKLLFSQFRRTRGSAVLVVNPDGTGLQELTPPCPAGSNSCTYDSSPSWSPDGRRITFDRAIELENGTTVAIYVMNADGSGQASIATTAVASVGGGPVFSPDGTTIAYSERDTIHIVSAAGGAPIRTISAIDPIQPGTLSWSPDGGTLLFQAGGPEGVYSVRADGTNLRKLTDAGIAIGPIWSPDGQRIALTRADTCLNADDPRGLRCTAWVMNADGSNAHPVTDAFPKSVVADWQAIPAPKRSDYKNAAQFCNATQAFWGAQFSQHYRTFGQCVSGSR